MVPSNRPVFRASLLCVQASAHALLGDYRRGRRRHRFRAGDLKVADSEYAGGDQPDRSRSARRVATWSGAGRSPSRRATGSSRYSAGAAGQRARVAGLCRPALATGPACSPRLPPGDGWRDDRDAGGTAPVAASWSWPGRASSPRRRAGAGATQPKWLTTVCSRPATSMIYAARHELQRCSSCYGCAASVAERVCLQLGRIAGLPARRHADTQNSLVLAELGWRVRGVTRNAPSKLEAVWPATLRLPEDRRLRLS